LIGGVPMAVEAEKIRYCENCKEETVHHAYEDALEFVYRCKQCDEQTEIVKSFF
jgi:hypothetical protein